MLDPEQYGLLSLAAADQQEGADGEGTHHYISCQSVISKSLAPDPGSCICSNMEHNSTTYLYAALHAAFVTCRWFVGWDTVVAFFKTLRWPRECGSVHLSNSM